MRIFTLTDLLGDRPPWQELALCAEVDPEVFFPDQGEATRPAKRSCSRCQVRRECLDAALDANEPYGVWGGLSRRERELHTRNPSREAA